MWSIFVLVAVVPILVAGAGEDQYVTAACRRRITTTSTFTFLEPVEVPDASAQKAAVLQKMIDDGVAVRVATTTSSTGGSCHLSTSTTGPSSLSSSTPGANTTEEPSFELTQYNLGNRSDLCMAQDSQCVNFLFSPESSLFGYFQGCYAGRIARDKTTISDEDLTTKCHRACQECDYDASALVDYRVNNAACDCTLFKPESVSILPSNLDSVCLKTCSISKKPGQPVDGSGTGAQRNPWSAVIKRLQTATGSCLQSTGLTSVLVLTRRITLGPLSACLAGKGSGVLDLSGSLIYIDGTETIVKKAKQVASTTVRIITKYFAVYVNMVIRRFPAGVTPIALPSSTAQVPANITALLVYHTTGGDLVADKTVTVPSNSSASCLSADAQDQLFCTSDIGVTMAAPGISLIARSTNSYQLLGLYTGVSSAFLSVRSILTDLQTDATAQTIAEVLADAKKLRLEYAIPTS